MIPDKNIKKIDLPEVSETFVDSLGVSSLDGSVCRFEFCVTRMREIKEGQKEPRADRYPSCRLVMPVNTAVELYNMLNRYMGVLSEQGLIKQENNSHVTMN